MFENLKAFWNKHFGQGIPFENMYDMGDGGEPSGPLPEDMINLPFFFVLGMLSALCWTL